MEVIFDEKSYFWNWTYNFSKYLVNVSKIINAIFGIKISYQA